MGGRFAGFLLALAAAVPSIGNAATLGSVTYTGSGTLGSVPLAASVIFSWSDTNVLTVTLRNTAGANAGADVPGSTLTGVFWNLVPSITLTAQTATVASGSTLVNPGACDVVACTSSTTNVGGEFGYQSAALPNSADRGIASSGYLTTGLAGNIGNFGGNGQAGTNLAGPTSLDGINFGIISANDTTFTPNGGLQTVPLIRDAVVFTLTGAGIANLTAADFNNVSFQYGTALNEANLTGCVPGSTNCTPVIHRTPEPGSLALMGVALLGWVGSRRRPT